MLIVFNGATLDLGICALNLSFTTLVYMLKERKSYTYYPHFLHEDTNGERLINLLQAIQLV